MKALYTADVHGDLTAWNKYTELLSASEYDFGLLGGDLTDEHLTLQSIRELASVQDDELLEELYDPEDTIEELEKRITAFKQDPTTPLSRAAKQLEQDIKAILRRADKPVFLIPGNHDLSDWSDTDLITNVHDRRIDIGALNVVGYRYTDLDRDRNQQARDVRRLMSLVDRNTILITHAPRLGVLERNYRGISIGSKDLRQLVRRRKPFFHLCGHVHDSFGVSGTSANGSYVPAGSFIAVDTDKRALSLVAR